MAAGPQVKGKRKVDEHCLLSDSGEVHEDYDCMLNQTNIEKNNNKFYVIQVIKAQNIYYVWTRWGRVGEEGKSKLSEDLNTLESAVEYFEKTFKKKTDNDWSNRENFVTHAGKYAMIEVDGEQDTEIKVPVVSSDKEATESTKLDIKEMMPLGKLSELQIAKGFEVLGEIEVAVNQEKGNTVLQELSSKFFTTIPRNFGRNRPPTIDSKEMVDQEKAMLTKSQQMAKRSPIHPPQDVQ